MGRLYRRLEQQNPGWGIGDWDSRVEWGLGFGSDGWDWDRCNLNCVRQILILPIPLYNRFVMHRVRYGSDYVWIMDMRFHLPVATVLDLSGCDISPSVGAWILKRSMLYAYILIYLALQFFLNILLLFSSTMHSPESGFGWKCCHNRICKNRKNLQLETNVDNIQWISRYNESDVMLAKAQNFDPACAKLW